jgi:hypothetical protein
VSATTVPANAAIKAVALAPADAVASGAQARCWKENKC